MRRPIPKWPGFFAAALMLFPLALPDPVVAQTRSSSYCDSYARQSGGGALAGAARGAVGGAVVGGIVKGKKGARKGSKIGGATGLVAGAARQNTRYKELYSRCINGHPL